MIALISQRGKHATIFTYSLTNSFSYLLQTCKSNTSEKDNNSASPKRQTNGRYKTTTGNPKRKHSAAQRNIYDSFKMFSFLISVRLTARTHFGAFYIVIYACPLTTL